MTLTPINTYLTNIPDDEPKNYWEMVFTFPDEFDSPNGDANDDIWCTLRRTVDADDLRVKCTYTLDPLIVTIGQEDTYTNEMDLSAGIAYEIRIFSRYEYPNGIKLPD